MKCFFFQIAKKTMVNFRWNIELSRNFGGRVQLSCEILCNSRYLFTLIEVLTRKSVFGSVFSAENIISGYLVFFCSFKQFFSVIFSWKSLHGHTRTISTFSLLSAASFNIFPGIELIYFSSNFAAFFGLFNTHVTPAY